MRFRGLNGKKLKVLKKLKAWKHYNLRRRKQRI